MNASSPQEKGVTDQYIEPAREYLKGKDWMKSWRLGEALGISPQRAGKVLKALPEWEPWNPDAKNRRYRLWKRVRPDEIDRVVEKEKGANCLQEAA